MKDITEYPTPTESANLKHDIARLLADKPVAHFKTKALDHLMSGVKPRMTLVCAEPGAGKTTMLVQMADELAAQGIKVLFFSFEVAREQLLAKSLSRASGGELPVGSIADGTPEMMKALGEAAATYNETIADNIIYIDEPATPVDISVIVGRVKRENKGKPVAVFIDYVQVTPRDSTRPYVDERTAVKDTVAAIRRIVNGHQVPVYAISSINRTSYAREGADLSSLAESSALEYAADAVYLLAVKGKGDERKENMQRNSRPVVIRALKNRYGHLGEAELLFDTRFATFLDRG